MLVCILDYSDGSVHFHKIPENIDDAEAYICTQFDYSSMDIEWMEVLK